MQLFYFQENQYTHMTFLFLNWPFEFCTLTKLSKVAHYNSRFSVNQGRLGLVEIRYERASIAYKWRNTVSK